MDWKLQQFKINKLICKTQHNLENENVVGNRRRTHDSQREEKFVSCLLPKLSTQNRPACHEKIRRPTVQLDVYHQTPTCHMSHQKKSKGKFTHTSRLSLPACYLHWPRMHPMRGGRTWKTLIFGVWFSIVSSLTKFQSNPILL